MADEHSLERQLNQLRTWNLVVGVILAVQAILIAGLTNSFALPVTATFMTNAPGSVSRYCTICLISSRVGEYLRSWQSQPWRCY
jgi:hypothetical protein